ncbi:taperin-like isoform X2 [Hyperolius riggenbachi]|uniref:taperin-like isoform X2 n=1 Tax=Hyperolius riggenbachi TaxID=752182 RepID=UPI0035A2B61C
MAVSGGTKSWSRLESGKMPAWKQEVLERKRQKMASSAGPQSSRGKDASPSRSSKKGSPERLVLQDSLGPIKENPFIKLEKERRRRRPQQQHHHHPPAGSGRATSPIRQLLDIYSHVPGIRTIRADNIIIIESDPGYFKQSSHVAGAATGDPVEELLAKRGSKVAEIRASEVIIYEPEVPKKEAANKSPVEAKREPQEHNQVLEEAGRVSRLLEKFNPGNSRPVRTRSWENLLERDQKPLVLPKPPSAERHGQAPQNKAPRRSGEVSPSSASIFEEDSKRFPLNNPSWLPSKPPALHSLPDPGLFHKRPSSPIMPPPAVAPVSPTSPLTPLSPHYELSSNETLVSPVVASVREKFEIGYTNNHPLPKLMSVSHRTGSNTIIVNPKAASISKAHSQDTTDGGVPKNAQHLTNGHAEHSEMNAKSGGSVNIQDLLSKSRRPRGSTSTPLPETSGVVPSSNKAANEVSKGANDHRRPKSEVELPKNSMPPKSSATLAESSFPNHYDQGFTSATPSQLLKVASSTSSNDSFEIRPAPKPDLSSIPEDDIQAKALANIRLQSKNTFVFVPKKRQVPSEPKQPSLGKVSTNEKPKVQISASTLNGPKVDSTDSIVYYGTHSKERPDLVNGDDGVEQVENSASSAPSMLDFDWKRGLVASKTRENQSFTDIGAELEYFSNVQQGDASGVLNVPVTKIHEDLAKPDIPVTNIDDIVNTDDRETIKETKPIVKVTADPVTPAYRPHASLSSVRTKGPNTFTIIPKRKPVTEQEAFRTPVVEEEDEDDTGSKRKSSDGSEALYPELGALLKKRYPTVDEIKVIGGYMSLSKSCLSKIGSSRKKMKISFNEQNIHTMFEYPSENSLAEGEDDGSESDDEDRPSGTIFPRASFGSSGGNPNSLRTKSPNSDLSNYTPKHSMEYSRWQDEKTLERSSSQDSDSQSDDMQKKTKLGRS